MSSRVSGEFLHFCQYAAKASVGCMIRGAWFNSCSVIVPGIISSHKALPTKPLRFVRLVGLRYR